MSEHLSVYMKQHHASPQKTTSDPRPSIPLAYWLVQFLRFVVVLASLGLIFARTLPLLLARNLDVPNFIRTDELGHWFIVLYKMLLHTAFAVAEMGGSVAHVLPPKSLDNRFHRGFLLSFVGLLDLVESRDDDASQMAIAFQNDGLSARAKFATLLGFTVHVSSRLLVAAGAIYALFGVASCWKRDDRDESRRR